MSGFCPSCRAPAAPGASRCSRCNAFLDGAQAGAPPPIAATSFGQPAYEPPPGGFGGPPGPPGPPAGGGYGAPPAQGGYGAPPAPGGYGGPPAGGGYGAPPAPGGYGGPPAPGGYGGPPGGGYGAPAPGGYGGPPAPGGYGAPPGPGMGAPGMGAPGMYGAPAPNMGYGGAPAYAPPPRKTGMSGCGIAAIVGAVVALLFGGLIVVGAVAAANSSSDDESSTPPPDPPPSDDGSSPEYHDSIPDSGALKPLFKDRIGAYRLGGVGEITSLAPVFQGGIADSKAAEYLAPSGQKVTVFMIAYGSQELAAAKIQAVEAIARTEPGRIVTTSPIYDKARRVVGNRVRVLGSPDPQRVYWTNGRLLCFVTGPAPHAVGFEAVAPF